MTCAGQRAQQGRSEQPSDGLNVLGEHLALFCQQHFVRAVYQRRDGQALGLGRLLVLFGAGSGTQAIQIQAQGVFGFGGNFGHVLLHLHFQVSAVGQLRQPDIHMLQVLERGSIEAVDSRAHVGACIHGLAHVGAQGG